MQPLRSAMLLSVFVAATAHAPAGEPTRNLYVINRAHDSITALAVAEPGTREFHELALGGSLRGGGEGVTVPVIGSTCRYDVRIVFRNGRSMIYPSIDVCRQQSLRIERPRLRAEGARLARD